MADIVFTHCNPCARPVRCALLSGAHENALSRELRLTCAPHPCPVWCSGNHHHCNCAKAKAKAWLPSGSQLRAEPAGGHPTHLKPPATPTVSLKCRESPGCGMSLFRMPQPPEVR